MVIRDMKTDREKKKKKRVESPRVEKWEHYFKQIDKKRVSLKR